MALLKSLKLVIGLSKKGLTKLNTDLRRTKSNFRRNFGEISGMAKNAALAITGSLVAGVGMLVRQGAKMEKLRTVPAAPLQPKCAQVTSQPQYRAHAGRHADLIGKR